MAFGATNAAAESVGGTFDISPDVVVPGDSVTLSATCDSPDFTAPAPVESGALTPVELTGEKDGAGVWHLTGKTTVRPDAASGTWSAMFQCGDEGVVANVAVEIDGEEPFATISIADGVIRAGQEIQVVATCRDPQFVSSGVYSHVMGADDLVRGKGASVNDPMTSKGRVDPVIKPGVYPLSFTCADREIKGEFTIVAGEKPAPAKTEPAKKTDGAAKAQVPVKPKGAADTGSLDAPAEDGVSAVLIGAGATALLVAGGVGVLAYRRRA